MQENEFHDDTVRVVKCLRRPADIVGQSQVLLNHEYISQELAALGESVGDTPEARAQILTFTVEGVIRKHMSSGDTTKEEHWLWGFIWLIHVRGTNKSQAAKQLDSNTKFFDRHADEAYALLSTALFRHMTGLESEG